MPSFPSFRPTISLLFASVLPFASTAVSAASYNPEELGKAAGPYLYPLMLIEEFQRAGCGNAFRKNHDVDAAIAEIKATLSPAHAPEVDQIVPPVREEANKFVKGFFVAGAKDKVDRATLCGMATGVVLPLKQSGDSKWENAKTRYRFR